MKPKIKKILLPIHPLSNLDIEEYFRIMKIKGKVYPRDKIPKSIKSNSCIVINLAPSNSNTNGTHWVLLINSNKEPSILYYDSFGVEFPPERIMKMKNTKPLVANNSQNQDINSIKCGYYVLKVAKSILIDKLSYFDTMKLFTDTPSHKNENISDNL